MASTYEKSVKGATKVKMAAPKSKYIEHLLMATQVGAVDQVFRPLSFRLKDSTWTIVFKSLIVAHILIRDGAKDVSLRYLAEQPRYFSTSHISSALVSEQGENIRDYARYLQVRVQAWRELKYDYASQHPNGDHNGRLKKLDVEKGLLREVEGVSRLVGVLLKCKFFLGDLSNDVTLTAFRLLVSDLLALFQPLNEGVMNVLSHYFEMSRTDAERSLRIYKTFVERTNEVIEYLSEAKALEHAMRLQIPNVKHAPTGLTQALEEYLNDPDFENNRRQYIEGRERGKSFSANTANPSTASKANATETKPAQPPRPDPTNPFNSLTGNRQPSVTTTTAPQKQQNQQHLVDFFASIENEQTSMFPSPQQQQQQQFPPSLQGYSQSSAQPFASTANQQFFTPQQSQSYQSFQTQPQQQFTSPQQPIRPEWTGAGFGGYTPSSAGSPVTIMPTISSAPAPQTQFQQPVQNSGLQVENTTGTNPFRASMMPAAQPQSFSPDLSTGQSSQGTNPFATGQRTQTMSPQLSHTQSFSSQTSYSPAPQQQSTYQQPFQNVSQTAFQPQSSVFQTQSQPAFQPTAQPSQSQQTMFPAQSGFQPQTQTQSTFQPQQPAFQTASSTGTNPFARPQPAQTQARLTPQVTGSNPFRQSIMPGGSATTTDGFGWSQ